ncbi:MAG: DNA recombination protein RmuC, partial [Gammaproteobacteria bacterium]
MEFLHNLAPAVLLAIGVAGGVAAMLFVVLFKSSSRRRLDTQLAVAEEKLKLLADKEAECRNLQSRLIEARSVNADLNARLEEQGKAAADKLKLLQQAEAQLKIQFEHLAGRIFEERSRQLTEHNKASMEHIVTPLKQQLGEFKNRIESLYDSETKDRITLRQEIVSLRRDTEKMNQEALNLTRALKGSKKAQGNWGEMILEKVLERSGLRKNVEYETHGAFRDGDNRLYKPDVIVRLPENKDV